MSKSLLLTLARYDTWATTRLYRHVDALPEADYRRDAGLFFKSVHGTLNHLLVTGQMLWWQRFTRGVSPSIALNEEVETDRAALREKLLQGTAAWEPWLQTVDDERLAGRLDYVTTKGKPASPPFAPALLHVFNHGTHHRGQITAAITALGHPAPDIDLLRMMIEERPTP